MRLFSSEAKDWKSSVVSEGEPLLVKESAEAAQKATEVQEAIDKQFQARWRQAEAQPRDMCESNSAQLQQLADRLHNKSELEHQQLHTANERRLQLETQALKVSQDMEQQRSRSATTTGPISSTAGPNESILEATVVSKGRLEAETHALHTELANMAEKSELQTTLSAKMISLESPRPTVEVEPENLLNTVGPCGSPSWILPSQLVTPRRATTSGEQTLSSAPISYCPTSPPTQGYRLDTPRPPPPTQCQPT